MPYICFIDEAGCPGTLPSATSPIQPALAIVGMFIDADAVPDLTTSFVKIKRTYFPGSMTSSHLLDDLLVEIKGADVRSAIRKHGLNAKRHLKFLDEVLALLTRLNAKIVAVCWVKKVARSFDGRAVYARSIQMVCESFQAFLQANNDRGFLVADFREPKQNARVAHSVFTQRFRAAGDRYPRLLELPVFGHSENHAALQVTDLLCSAMILPAVTHVYCTGYVKSMHVHPKDGFFKGRFIPRLKRMQYRYFEERIPHGGIIVFDGHAKRPTSVLFGRGSTGSVTPHS